MSAAITFRNVGKVFRARQGMLEALREFSLAVPTNSFCALVGPSGCGKSTLLHIAAGLDSHYIGECTITPQQCRKAYLFQSPRLLTWLTAEKNVAFVQEAHGIPLKEAREEARHYLRLVGLAGFEQHFPNQLSGGMQQRIALARALIVKPDIMLMDEPMAALDEITARHMRQQILQLHTDSPCTVLFVTHNITEAVFLADRVGVMSDRPGRLVVELPIDLPRPREYDDPSVALIAREIVRYLQPARIR
jgi:NitT/TauT family transport system ATP-binding protein